MPTASCTIAPTGATLVEDRTWSRCAAAYARLFPVTDFYVSLVHTIHRHLPDSGRILDLGCGPGVLVESLLSPSRVVYGVDINEDMLAEARGRLPAEAAAILLRGDARSLDFPDGFFRGANASNLLCFFEDPHPILQELHRVLEPSGILTITGPTPWFSIETLVGACREDLCRKRILDQYADDLALTEDVGVRIGAGPVKRYTSSELSVLVREAGFSEIVLAADNAYAGQCHFVKARK